MAKYLIETFYTCSFKINHYLDDISENELNNLEKRDDGKFEILDIKLDNRKTKNLDSKKEKNNLNKDDYKNGLSLTNEKIVNKISSTNQNLIKKTSENIEKRFRQTKGWKPKVGNQMMSGRRDSAKQFNVFAS